MSRKSKIAAIFTYQPPIFADQSIGYIHEDYNFDGDVEFGAEGLGDIFSKIGEFISKLISSIVNFVKSLFGGSSSDESITKKVITNEKEFEEACRKLGEELGKKINEEFAKDAEKESITIDFSDGPDFSVLLKWLDFSNDSKIVINKISKLAADYLTQSPTFAILQQLIKAIENKNEKEIEGIKSKLEEADHYLANILELKLFTRPKFQEYGVDFVDGKVRFKVDKSYQRGPDNYQYKWGDKNPLNSDRCITEFQNQHEVIAESKTTCLKITDNLKTIKGIVEKSKSLSDDQATLIKKCTMKCIHENMILMSVLHSIRGILMYRTKYILKTGMKFTNAMNQVLEKINRLDGTGTEALMDPTFTGSFSDLIPYAEQLQADCLTIKFATDLSMGKEGFFDFMFRLLTGIADLIGRLFRNFKLVYRVFRGLKRTELHDYTERYLATVVRIKNINYREASIVQIPLPKGLNTTYVDVTQKILACLQLCDMKNRAKSFAVTSKNLATKVQNSIPTNDSIAVLFEQSTQIEQINNFFNQYDKCFDKSSANQADFGKLFRSSDEFQLEFNLLNDHAKYMYDIHSVYKSLEECNDSMQQAVQAAKARKNNNAMTTISKEELVSLSNACLFMAKTFDTYGLSVQDLHRVEHNYVEVMKTIQRKFKL